MNSFVKIALIITMAGSVLSSFADRGINKKAKSRVSLNIGTGSFTNNLSFNLKTGLKYTGSLLVSSTEQSTLSASNIVTYQKGNSIYILPVKQKLVSPEMKQGYTGMKFIIHSH